MTPVEQLLIQPHHPIRDAMATIDRGGRGIALVVDDEHHLVGTITDGDIRRAILNNIKLEEPASLLLERKAGSIYSTPVTARAGTPPEELQRLMHERYVQQLPLLDAEGRVVELVTLNDLLPVQELPLQGVIMAGGLGTRLRPLTEDLPKPMLPVGGRPLIEHIVSQLRRAGIRHITITTYYKPEKIRDHFGDGSGFGVEIAYVQEEKQLGTGGALALLPTPEKPLLVINGDILTQVDFRSMFKFHREHDALLTVAVRQYDLQVPYGVLECEGVYVQQLREKPVFNFLVNAGIYLVDPAAHSIIPYNKHFNMTDLIQALIDDGKNVASFPIVEYWLDIGQHADYLRAQEDMIERENFQ